ncbi:MAG: cupin [Erythrobacter sp. RIFCSPHIGHO2_12_FULL_63_10]|nr:MAG: cupin [Erythrobacter sp. RIFCSPHIGHO2_12_FULL_63_10]
MQINANFEIAVGVQTSALEWRPSPMPGVDRRMLDRIGGEVARATSIVRYAPGSHFSAHRHDGGEEFIVLEGTFQDEHGAYPAGTYVRNPVGTRHTPRSDNGCTIFVKLWQFDPDDQAQFALDLATIGLGPVSGASGIKRAILHERNDELVLFEHWQPGAERCFGPQGGVELLVLEGSVTWQGQNFGEHGWIRLPCDWRGSAIAGQEGAKVWIKSHHLAEIHLPTG